MIGDALLLTFTFGETSSLEGLRPAPCGLGPFRGGALGTESENVFPVGDFLAPKIFEVDGGVRDTDWPNLFPSITPLEPAAFGPGFLR